MTMTYATVTGKVTPPGGTAGVPGRIEATPMVAGEVLSFPADNVTTLGPAVAQIAADGTLEQVALDGTTSPGLQIPTDVPEGTYWRLEFFPKGSGLKTHLGDYEIPATADLADLVRVQVTALSPTAVADLTTARDEAVAAQAAAAASAQQAADLVLSDLGTTDGQTRALVENPASQTAVALSATIAARRIVTTPHLRVWGHSFAAGVGPGVNAATQGLAPLAAQQIGLPLSNLAVGGSVLAHSDGAAGWVPIMQAEKRPRSFDPYGGAFAMLHGINDVNRLGNTLANLLPYQHAYRAAVARFNCAAVFEDDDSTVTLGGSGTWAFVNGSVGNSGTRLAYNPTNGATITITTPASFPGGTIDLGFLAWTSGGGSGTITGPASLGSPTLNTGDFGGQPYRTTGVMRVKNVPAGAASYVFTTSGVSGSIGVIFDWWGWEAADEAAPVVAVIGQPKPLDYDAYAAGGVNGPPTDAGLTNVNAIHQAIADEFGPRTIYVDTSGIDKDPAYWTAGNVHPNPAGHAYIAEQVAAAMTAPASYVTARAATVPTGWIAYTPTISGVSSLGNGALTAFYVKDSLGTVTFYARLVLGSTTTIGGNFLMSLPVPPLGSTGPWGVLDVYAYDDPTAFYPLGGRIGASGVYVYAHGTTAGGAYRELSATAPFTWAAGDSLNIAGTYRTAP